MSTNERPHEKRTADEPTSDEPTPDQQTMPEDSPAHPEPDTDPDHPPQARLLVTGFSRKDVTADFLIDIHDLADDHDLDIESISVGEPDRNDE